MYNAMEGFARLFFLLLALGVIDSSVGQEEGEGVFSTTAFAGEPQSRGSNEGVENPDWNAMIASQNWNTVIDDLLKQLSTQIILQGKDQQSIKNLDEGFETNLGLVKAIGRFEATGGTIKNISSLHRLSDVIVTSIPGVSISVNTQLGFRHLHIHYPYYKAKLWRVGPTGEINARVEENVVEMSLRIDMNAEGCSIVLEEAKVKLGKLHTKVTGLKPFNWLLSRIFTWLTKECQTDIVKTIENTLDSQLRYVFANTALDC